MEKLQRLGIFGALIMLVALPCATQAASSTYFNWLVSQPEHLSSTSLRNPQEVIDQVFFSDKAKATTHYDAQYDAAKFYVKQNRPSIEIGDQVRHNFPYVDRGTLLIYWETLAPSYWARDGSVDGVNTYKAFQLSHDGDLTLELRYRFSQANSPNVARVDARVYGSQSGVSIGPADSAAPQSGEFMVRPDKWTQHWAFIDFTNNRFSYWVGDEDRTAVAILRSIPFDWQANYGSRYGFNQFWFEFNTSQSRSGPEANMYGRNLVVLKDVADLQHFIAQGSASGQSDIPQAPVIVGQ